MLASMREAVAQHRAAQRATAELYDQLREQRELMRQVNDHLRNYGERELERALAKEQATMRSPAAHARFRQRTEEILRQIEHGSSD
ncbi:hypothetical protein BJF78_24640 [Pseudonocardia sp. CNS-139]|nr:hypothetical protein BJF78_24640 [Pseudonocardia sp. CNS-139]